MADNGPAAVLDEILDPVARAFSRDVAEALVNLRASRSAQQRIAELAMDAQFGLDIRRTAAQKLAFHIQRFGLLLKQPAIDRLHKVWQSERENPELRTALGGVIGSLKPDAILAGKRLKSQASPTR